MVLVREVKVFLLENLRYSTAKRVRPTSSAKVFNALVVPVGILSLPRYQTYVLVAFRFVTAGVSRAIVPGTTAEGILTALVIFGLGAPTALALIRPVSRSVDKTTETSLRITIASRNWPRTKPVNQSYAN
jgi:hypothetical protein